MLTTLSQAKTFLLEKITEYTGEAIEQEEQDILETILEDNFFEKVSGLVDEVDIAAKHIETEEAMESYLFHKIPNYTTILEETTAEVIADYLSN